MKKGIVLIGVCGLDAVSVAVRLCKHNTKDIIVIGDTEPEAARLNIFRPEPEPIVYKAPPIMPKLFEWKYKNGKPFDLPKSKYHK